MNTIRRTPAVKHSSLALNIQQIEPYKVAPFPSLEGQNGLHLSHMPVTAAIIYDVFLHECGSRMVVVFRPEKKRTHLESGCRPTIHNELFRDLRSRLHIYLHIYL